MKTAKQIESWLKSQKWFPQFEKNIRSVLNEKGVQYVLSGEAGKITMDDVFWWYKSEEGVIYWQKRHDEFMEWYSSKRKALIIRTKNVDDRFTDMNTVWYTVYDLFFPDENVAESIKVLSEQGETFENSYPEIEIVPMTEELKNQYLSFRDREFQRLVDSSYAKYQKEVDEYNSRCPGQEKGQIVEVTKGRNRGAVGEIVWVGENKYGNGHQNPVGMLSMIIRAKPYSIPVQYTLFKIKRIDGRPFPEGVDTIFVPWEKCRVIEGFKPIDLTRGEVAECVSRKLQNLEALSGYYNIKNFVNLQGYEQQY